MFYGNQKGSGADPQNPLSYKGTKPNMRIMNRRLLSTDLDGFEIGWWWIIPIDDTYLTGEVWTLVSKADIIPAPRILIFPAVGLIAPPVLPVNVAIPPIGTTDVRFL